MKKAIALTILLLPALVLAACSPRLLAATEAPVFYGEPDSGFVSGEAVGLRVGASPRLPPEGRYRPMSRWRIGSSSRRPRFR